MKYLKIFESFTSDKFEEQIEDLFIGITDDLGAGIQVVSDQFNTGPRAERLQVKILLPHGYEHSPIDVYYKIKDELQPIHNKIMKDYELKFSGCSQLKRHEDPNYHGVVNLIYYKYETAETKVNKYLKQFESFGSFQLDEITRKEFVDIHKNREEESIDYESLQLMGSNIPKDYTLSHGDEWFTIHRCDESKKINTKISVDKVSQGGDEPFYTLQYYYDISKGNRYNDRHHFFRFEESDFNQMCKNPQILIDYLNKYFDESIIQMDGAIDESLFSEIPDPEPMDYNEWDDEVTNAKEVAFTQKEKELFISLSDTISVKNKRYMPEIGKSSLFFQLINGGLNQRLRNTTPIRNISTYKNDDEFYYVNVWGRDADDNQYRCDGYECWEKFLRGIFAGYRDLINNQTKTNESYFDKVPEPTSLLDENGDYIPGSSRARVDNREPFNQKEKLFINKLVDTLNEEYVSTNFSDSSEFVLNMGEMGETTHGMRVVKMMDDYYEVQYKNFVDSDDEYIYCECDGFKCLSKLLIRLFEKINKDYDYVG